MNFKFSRFSAFFDKAPVYMVTLNGVFLGCIEATAPGPRHGCNKNTYIAFPQKSNDRPYSTKSDTSVRTAAALSPPNRWSSTSDDSNMDGLSWRRQVRYDPTP